MSINTIGTYNNYNNQQYLNKKVTQVPQNNIKGQYPYNRDIINIHQKNKTKNIFPSIALGMIGAVGSLYVAVVGHRMLTKPTLEKCAKNFSEIFRRDVSKEEAQKIITNYKELFKIKDNEEFCKKAFEQVKKDYGYENLDIPLKIEYNKDDIKLKNFTKMRVSGKWSPIDCSITYYSPQPYTEKSHNNFKFNKKDIISILIHEFQHVKQTEIAYRTSSAEYINMIEPNNLRKLKKIENNLRENLKNPNKLINKVRIQQNTKTNKLDELSTKYYKLFGNLTPLKPNSNNYKLGQDYMENMKNYISLEQNYKKYKNQLIEKEAYSAESKFDEIYNYFANPWRLF